MIACALRTPGLGPAWDLPVPPRLRRGPGPSAPAWRRGLRRASPL